MITCDNKLVDALLFQIGKSLIVVLCFIFLVCVFISQTAGNGPSVQLALNACEGSGSVLILVGMNLVVCSGEIEIAQVHPVVVVGNTNGNVGVVGGVFCRES